MIIERRRKADEEKEIIYNAYSQNAHGNGDSGREN